MSNPSLKSKVIGMSYVFSNAGQGAGIVRWVFRPLQDGLLRQDVVVVQEMKDLTHGLCAIIVLNPVILQSVQKVRLGRGVLQIVPQDREEMLKDRDESCEILLRPGRRVLFQV